MEPTIIIKKLIPSPCNKLPCKLLLYNGIVTISVKEPIVFGILPAQDIGQYKPETNINYVLY